MLYRFVFLITLGITVSFLQEMVLKGIPLKITSEFFGEVLFSIIYLGAFIALQRQLLARFSAQARKGMLEANRLALYFLLLQLAGFVWLFVLGIGMIVIATGKWQFQLKDFASLRFILVYYFFINTIIFAVGVAYRWSTMYRREKDAKHLAEKAYMNTQLQMLRQQLNPHFLFNNLNIIAATIKSKPQLAHDFTRSMAAFYRKLLETEQGGLIILREELKMAEYYLYMLSIRFEDKLSYRLQVAPEEAERYLIPDFVLQPVLENAVKHNTLSKERPLEVVISVIGGRLRVTNTWQPKPDVPEGLGIGWSNVSNRFKHLGAGEPLCFQEAGLYIVELPLMTLPG